MGDSVLLRFLNNGLINVGGEDAKLEKLSHAAKDLAGALKKAPSKALSFSLIAFDPEAPESDPVVLEALAALQARWTTYRNTFSSTPIAVIRAMLLDALMTAAGMTIALVSVSSPPPATPSPFCMPTTSALSGRTSSRASRRRSISAPRRSGRLQQP